MILLQGLPVTGNVESTAPENRAFYPALDGLRAIAFLMVFFHHYSAMPWGWAGVNIFFVLSGFLITGILFDSRDDPHRVRTFYVRRTLRIFPLYYGICLILLLLAPFLHWQWNWHWLVWPAYVGNLVGYVHPYTPHGSMELLADAVILARNPAIYTPLNFGHFWTLCVEEQFYLVWPWIVFAIRDRRVLIWICAASLPVCLAARIFGMGHLPQWMMDHDVLAHATPFRVDDLLLGGLLALLLRGPLAARILNGARIAAPFILLATVLWFALTPARHFLTRPYPYPSTLLTYGFDAISLLSALVILLALQPKSIVCRFLSLYTLRWMGRISYGAYVFHDIFHNFYFKLVERLDAHLLAHHAPFSQALFDHRRLISTGLSLVLTYLLAWVSFEFFESRFLRLKSKFAPPRAKPEIGG